MTLRCDHASPLHQISKQAQLISHPETLIGTFKPGEPITMELSVDVYPEVKFTGDYKGLKVGTYISTHRPRRASIR